MGTQLNNATSQCKTVYQTEERVLKQDTWVIRYQCQTPGFECAHALL